MDCRRPVVYSLACLLALAARDAAALQMPESGGFAVAGGDFPSLTQAVDIAPRFDADGVPVSPGCDGVRARRIDELALPWRHAVASVQLDCEALAAAYDGFDTLAIAATAVLEPGTVSLAGQPVAEVRLMDSELWGDHQYVLEAPFSSAHEALKQHVESHCAQRHLRDEHAGAADCAMSENDGGLYLSTDEISGIWIHADPDDPQRTIYAEAWAD